LPFKFVIGSGYCQKKADECKRHGKYGMRKGD